MSRSRPWVGDVAFGLWERLGRAAMIQAGSRRASRFAGFGEGSFISFPAQALYGEGGIVIGRNTGIAAHCSITAGLVPGQTLISDRILVIGDRCVIGRGSTIGAHFSVEIGDDVYFGPNVYVTDQNHSSDDPDVPLGRQSAPESPVSIGDGSWLGTGVVVTPGVTIGRRVTVGANSVVTSDLPDGCTAVGAPARVVSA